MLWIKTEVEMREWEWKGWVTACVRRKGRGRETVEGGEGGQIRGEIVGKR